MGDLFDIANLITTVGVEAVKIKPEPGLPEKSSNEILTELFNTFVAENESDSENEGEGVKVKTEKKKKKKKHKHKDRKHKKKSKHADYSSDNDSDNETSGSRKKKKHKKKSKRKHDDNSSKSSDSDRSSANVLRLEAGDISSQLVQSDEFDIFSKFDSVIKLETNDCDPLKEAKETKKNDFPELSLPLEPPKLPAFDTEETEVPILPEKTKSQGKILIKDLKNSAVYNEAVKEVENKEREKAERMEDGEISNSTNDRTPTLSPSPSRKDSLSPSSRTYIVKDDLRLILKEKEKRKRKKSRSRSRSKLRNDRKDGKSHRDRRHKSKEKDSKRSRSCQSRGTKSEQRSRSNGRERDRNRSRSRDRRNRGRSRDKRDSYERRKYDKDCHRSRSYDRSRDRYGKGRSRSKERKERIEIDKKKLLEIARKNAINMIKQGALPLAQQNKAIAAIQAGGKSVEELTDFCKSLSKSEALGDLSSISDDDSSSSEKGFHHPFLLKERPMSIIMNIRDAKQLPTKTFQEKTAESSSQLRLQFPVSSGQLHRKTENEWVPVVPQKKPEPTKKFIQALEPLCSSQPVPVPAPVQPPLPAAPVNVPGPQVFPSNSRAHDVDIGSIVSQRLAAMRKLRENPNDVQALNEMYKAQNGMRSWAESKQMPGQFVGTTGAKVLTPAELAAGYQAWARKDQLLTALPVSGGMGMALLQKMGWRPGEGLGKNKEGTLEPLQLEVKLDKKGLVSDQDIGIKSGKASKPVIPTTKTLIGKHPVSLLGEYCSKRKYGAPVYELCFECGPDHKKNFLFKVKVNGVEYKPTVASPNKKQAKSEAAQICLQTLGLLPS